MMALDLDVVLLLVAAFALGGVLAFLLRRRAQRRAMSGLATATLMSLEVGGDEPDAPRAAPPARPADADRSTPFVADSEPSRPAAAAPPPAEDNAGPPAVAAPPPAAPEPAAQPAAPASAAKPARARAAPAAKPPRTPLRVPHDAVPLAPLEPELPLDFTQPAPPAKSRRAPRPAPAPGLADAAPPAASPPPAAAPLEVPVRLEAPEGAPDDLRRIKGIGPQNAQRLNALGIYHWRQIAAWTPPQVRWVGAALAFPGRIERERWVAQAQALLEAHDPPA